MALGTRQTPSRAFPLFSQPPIAKAVLVSKVLTTAGGVVTMTPAELLTGFAVVDTQDAQTWTLPTAALLNAAIPGVEVGSSFDFSVVNYGDTTLTIGLGTGITKTTIATVAAVMTIATLCAKRFRLVCTGVANPSVQGSADSWVVYAFGSTAAAVA